MSIRVNEAAAALMGALRLARFNAPFIPPFLRHNEVVVDVEPAVATG